MECNALLLLLRWYFAEFQLIELEKLLPMPLWLVTPVVDIPLRYIYIYLYICIARNIDGNEVELLSTTLFALAAGGVQCEGAAGKNPVINLE